jgi:hypothetical protein
MKNPSMKRMYELAIGFCGENRKDIDIEKIRDIINKFIKYCWKRQSDNQYYKNKKELQDF